MTEFHLDELRHIFERELKKAIDRPQDDFYSARLNESLLYAIKPPAKRLRPLLVLLMALSYRKQIPEKRAVLLAMPTALAVEYIHTYSLIHDDLPAMDDDDFRRGRLSVHRRFDEGLAILAGDAFLADAFYLALSSPNNPVQIGRELALTAGSRGLAAGQSEDLNRDVLHDELTKKILINKAKTARLFEACAKTGALSINAHKNEQTTAQRFGQSFGLAFQLQDDLDDGVNLCGQIDAIKQHVHRAKDLCESIPNSESLGQLIRLTFQTRELVFLE